MDFTLTKILAIILGSYLGGYLIPDKILPEIKNSKDKRKQEKKRKNRSYAYEKAYIKTKLGERKGIITILYYESKVSILERDMKKWILTKDPDPVKIKNIVDRCINLSKNLPCWKECIFGFPFISKLEYRIFMNKDYFRDVFKYHTEYYHYDLLLSRQRKTLYEIKNILKTDKRFREIYFTAKYGEKEMIYARTVSIDKLKKSIRLVKSFRKDYSFYEEWVQSLPKFDDEVDEYIDNNYYIPNHHDSSFLEMLIEEKSP